MKKFEGVMPALVTPLKSDRKTVDEGAARKLIDFLIGQGADGFYILGSTGEGLVLSEEERMKMCEIVTDHVKGKKNIICHVAATDFESAVRLAKHAEKAGVDAISAIPPIFFAYSDDDIYNYYSRLASATSLPFIMYNNYFVNGGMSADIVKKMFDEIDNITGVKWTVNNYYELMLLKEMTHGEMNIINGPDEMLICGLSSGADAGIGSTYNVMLPQYIEIYKSFREGNIKKAREIQLKVDKVIRIVKKYKDVPTVKHMIKMLGIDVGDATFPMKSFADDASLLEKELSEAGWPFKD